MRAAERIDQLPGDTNATACFAHSSFEDIADAQLAADLLYIYRLAFVGETRIAGDDEEPADARQCSDDLLDHPIREIFLFGITTHIGEGQHGDRRLVGKRKRGTYGRCSGW
jgi:hypothetical protein